MSDFAINGDGTRTFFLSGEIDMSSAPLVDTALVPAIAQAGPVTLDLSNLTFIDSKGVGSILRSLSAMPSGCILLHGVRSGPRRVFDIMMGSDPGAEHLHIITCTVSVGAATA